MYFIEILAISDSLIVNTINMSYIYIYIYVLIRVSNHSLSQFFGIEITQYIIHSIKDCNSLIFIRTRTN